MEFNSNLIRSNEQEVLEFDSSVKGLYNTMQFVLRLDPDVRDTLNNESTLTAERYQAFSTYLHENIHWWQHIGSNFGFLLNTSFPAHATNSFGHLKELIKKDIKSKPLVEYDKQYYSKHEIADIEELNIILNNFYDLQNAKSFALCNLNLEHIEEDRRFFLSIGHCYYIFWALPIETLSQIFSESSFLPNIGNWGKKFEELKLKKVEGFYPDSKYNISPIGIKAIFEGQAIFNQILYLKYAFKENKIIFKDFIDNGLLHGIYLEAFDTYLNILGEERPFFLEDDLIGLFLLICDISINPTNGFPIDIYDYENFINKNDPGIRFIFFCRIASEFKKDLLNRCKNLTKETYIFLSEFLNDKFECKCSYKTIKEVLKWHDHEHIQNLMKQEAAHSYDEENLPFKLFLAKFIRFQQDKFENPHLFCWIGYHIPNANDNNVMKIFEKHRALFTDSDDGEIKPVLFQNISKKNIYKTFNDFYYHTILYELILKWIGEEGQFKLDYKWLFSSRNDENSIKIKNTFKKNFEIDLDDIEIIN